jgi:hypothetical protein
VVAVTVLAVMLLVLVEEEQVVISMVQLPY